MAISCFDVQMAWATGISCCRYGLMMRGRWCGFLLFPCHPMLFFVPKLGSLLHNDEDNGWLNQQLDEFAATYFAALLLFRVGMGCNSGQMSLMGWAPDKSCHSQICCWRIYMGSLT
jgi:hypothetical protein